MIGLLLEVVKVVVGAALCTVLIYAYWWETSGRREHEREAWRRGMAERLPGGMRGSRLWTDDEDESDRA